MKNTLYFIRKHSKLYLQYSVVNVWLSHMTWGTSESFGPLQWGRGRGLATFGWMFLLIVFTISSSFSPQAFGRWPWPRLLLGGSWPRLLLGEESGAESVWPIMTINKWVCLCMWLPWQQQQYQGGTWVFEPSARSPDPEQKKTSWDYISHHAPGEYFIRVSHHRLMTSPGHRIHHPVYL